MIQLLQEFGDKLDKDVDIDSFKYLDVSFDCFLDFDESLIPYQILVAYFPSGLILYWFTRISLKDPTKPEPERAKFSWLFGAHISKLWKEANEAYNPTLVQVTPSETNLISITDPNRGYRDVEMFPNGNKSIFESSEVGSDVLLNGKTAEDKEHREAVYTAMAILSGGGSFAITMVALDRYFPDLAHEIRYACISLLKGTIGKKQFQMACTTLLSTLFTYEQLVENGIAYAEEQGYDELSEDEVDHLMEDFITAGNTPAPRDPLVIDLGKSGIELTSVKNGVHFDLDNNGFAEQTSWIGTDVDPTQRNVS